MSEVVNGDFGREASDLAEKIIDRIYNTPVGGLLPMLGMFAPLFPADEIDGLMAALRSRKAELAEAERENAAFDRGWDRAGDELVAERGAA